MNGKARVFKTRSGWTWEAAGLRGLDYSSWRFAYTAARAVAEVNR